MAIIYCIIAYLSLYTPCGLVHVAYEQVMFEILKSYIIYTISFDVLHQLYIV